MSETFDPEREAIRLPFPVTGPNDLVQVVDRETQKELRLLSRPEGLDSEIERARDTARITRVNKLSSNYGITHWDVDTDQGPKVFDVPDRDMIRSFPGGKVFLRDADGNRFEIPSLGRLDRTSRERVEREI